MAEYKMPSERLEWEELKNRIKEHEGFRDTIYKDSLGKATIGYGHLITEDDQYQEGQQYSVDLLDKQFDVDFDRSFIEAQELMEGYNLPNQAQEVVIEMVFQLGTRGVSRFKNMWAALKEHDFVDASDEMLDSRWFTQTPERCEELAGRMASCGIA
jgi:lysozyme